MKIPSSENDNEVILIIRNDHCGKCIIWCVIYLIVTLTLSELKYP